MPEPRFTESSWVKRINVKRVVCSNISHESNLSSIYFWILLFGRLGVLLGLWRKNDQLFGLVGLWTEGCYFGECLPTSHAFIPTFRKDLCTRT